MPLITRTDIQSPRLLEIAAYLDAKRLDDHAPSRAQIDPVTEIPRLTPHLVLIEQVAGRYRIRLVGSVVTEILGHDLTGRWIDEIHVEENSGWAESGLAMIFSTDTLFGGFSQPPWRTRAHVAFEWIAQRLTAVQGEPELAIFALDRRAPPPVS